MTRRRKRIILIIVAVLVIVPAAVIAFANTPPGRSFVSSLASNISGRTVDFEGHVYPVRIWPLTWYISDVTVENIEGARHGYMAQIGAMKVAIGRKSKNHGNLNLKYLSLINSNLNLERNAEGVANWSVSDKPQVPEESAGMPALGSLYLENSTFTYIDALQNADITITASSEEDELAFEGEGTYLGQELKLEGSMASDCLSNDDEPCPLEGSLLVGDTIVTTRGTLTELVPPLGADFMLDIEGADAAELFPLFGIVLPPTAPYELTGHLTYENENWHFEDFSGKMGQSDLSGSALWAGGLERPKLTAKLLSNKLRIQDLGPLIGIAPKQRLSDEQKARGAKQDASPYVIPDVPLDITKLSSMDADVEFTGKQVISEDLPLDNFYLKLGLDDRLMTMKPLKFGTARGNIAANITTNARQQPISQSAEINFNNLTLAGLFGDAGKSLGVVPPEGAIGGTLTLKGQGKSLREVLSNADGVAGLGMEGGKISNLLLKLLSLDIFRSLGFILKGDRLVDIRCVVASFDLKDGVMTTDTFVVDTDDTNIKGEGTVNLRDESLNLRLRPAPKEASALSLRSPIDLKGTLKHPDIAIEKGPIAARGGIAAGIAAVAPVAAVVAFFDRGKGKDSNCEALINAMNAKTGKTRATDKVPENPQ